MLLRIYLKNQKNEKGMVTETCYKFFEDLILESR